MSNNKIYALWHTPLRILERVLFIVNGVLLLMLLLYVYVCFVVVISVFNFCSSVALQRPHNIAFLFCIIYVYFDKKIFEKCNILVVAAERHSKNGIFWWSLQSDIRKMEFCSHCVVYSHLRTDVNTCVVVYVCDRMSFVLVFIAFLLSPAFHIT